MTSPGTRWWLTPALCVLLAIAHTWPLASAPGTLSRNDNGDAQLNEWIMAWVAHQLPRSPARLFNANIFYPARDTLAFSEPLIVPALMGAPLRWLGASPVLVFNVVLIAGFALSAWAMAALVGSWTGNRAAGLLAGSMFAFNTHTLTRLAHIQGIHTWGLPLALLAADRIITRTLVRDTIWLAVWMSAMAYTSGYLLVFGSVMIAVVVVVRAADWVRRPARVLSAFALSAALATVVSLPVYIPYHRVARDQGMVRSLANVAEYSATLKGYLAAAGRIHFSTWSGGFFRDPVDSFFPGVIVLALAGLALWRSLRRREPAESSHVTSQRVLMLAAIAATGFVLSLGTRTPVYGWLFHVFPPMQGLRAAARFGNLFLLGMAGLAGLGLAGLLKRLPATSRDARGHRARRCRERRVSACALPLHALRRNPRHLLNPCRGARTRRARRNAFLPAAGRVRERRVRPGVNGSLAAAHERLQWLRARVVPHVCRIVLVLSGGLRHPGNAESGRHARDGASAAVLSGRGQGDAEGVGEPIP